MKTSMHWSIFTKTSKLKSLETHACCISVTQLNVNETVTVTKLTFFYCSDINELYPYASMQT